MANEDNTFKWSLGETRTMFCLSCKEPVQVNINYPIHSVTCRVCYAKEQREHEAINPN